MCSDGSIVDCGERATGAAGEQAYSYNFFDAACGSLAEQSKTHCKYNLVPYGRCNLTSCDEDADANKACTSDDVEVEGVPWWPFVLISLALLCGCATFLVSYFRGKGTCQELLPLQVQRRAPRLHDTDDYDMQVATESSVELSKHSMR